MLTLLEAIILCSPLTREYLINYARPLIYTTFMSYPSLAAIRAVYDHMMDGETVAVSRATLYTSYLMTHADTPQPIAHLWKLVTHLHTLLLTLSLPSTHTLLCIPQQCPQSPIFSLLTPQPRSLAREFQEAGFVVRAIVAPTVPVGAERVRVCLHAGNRFEEVGRLVGVIGRWVERVEAEAVMHKARL